MWREFCWITLVFIETFDGLQSCLGRIVIDYSRIRKQFGWITVEFGQNLNGLHLSLERTLVDYNHVWTEF